MRAAASTRAALTARIADLQSRRQAAEAALNAISLDELNQVAASAQSALQEAESANGRDADALAAADIVLTDAQKASEEATNLHREADIRSTRLQAEIDALGYLLVGEDGSGDAPYGQP